MQEEEKTCQAQILVREKSKPGRDQQPSQFNRQTQGSGNSGHCVRRTIVSDPGEAQADVLFSVQINSTFVLFFSVFLLHRFVELLSLLGTKN